MLFRSLELFHLSANKWESVRVLAEGWKIPPARICAIGDQVNDVSMIEQAGLGIAMGNAIEPVRKAAKRHTKRNDEDGVAHAIEQVLGGHW